MLGYCIGYTFAAIYTAKGGLLAVGNTETFHGVLLLLERWAAAFTPPPYIVGPTYRCSLPQFASLL
jgi:hypothetical protein